MRIDELKRIAEENDYEYEADSMKHQFKRQTRRINISKKDEKTLWITSNSYCDDKDFNMIKAAVEFAETPPEDREEKKFYLRHRWFKPKSVYKNYLNHWIGTKEYCLDYKNETEEVQTQFTKKEIEEIKEKFDTDLADFKEVEVKDD